MSAPPDWDRLEAEGKVYISGGPAVGKVLKCPQLKNPTHVEGLAVNWHTNYVLEFFWHNPGEDNQQLVHIGATNSVTGLPAIATRLRNGGFLRDISFHRPGGYARELSAEGVSLLNRIRKDVQAGAVLYRRTDPRVG